MATSEDQPSGDAALQRFFVFVRCEPGKANSVGLQIARSKKDIVRETSSISGEWDLLLLLEIRIGMDVGREISKIFTDIKGIVRTYTIVAYRIFASEN